MNGYELSRKWFDFCFDNPDKINATHTALYLFSVEYCNRLGWKSKFGLPTEMTKEAIGVKNWHTYIKVFNDLVEWKFFILIEKSKNQYTSNIIALSEINEAPNKALDEALTKHESKQHQSTYQSIDSIIKQINSKQLTLKQVNELQKAIDLYFDKNFNFEKSLINYGFEKQLVTDWLIVRKTKRASNTKTAFDNFIIEIEKTKKDKNELLKIIVGNSWQGFNSKWILGDKPTPPTFVETRLKK